MGGEWVGLSADVDDEIGTQTVTIDNATFGADNIVVISTASGTRINVFCFYENLTLITSATFDQVANITDIPIPCARAGLYIMLVHINNSLAHFTHSVTFTCGTEITGLILSTPNVAETNTTVTYTYVVATGSDVSYVLYHCDGTVTTGSLPTPPPGGNFQHTCPTAGDYIVALNMSNGFGWSNVTSPMCIQDPVVFSNVDFSPRSLIYFEYGQLLTISWNGTGTNVSYVVNFVDSWTVESNSLILNDSMYSLGYGVIEVTGFNKLAHNASVTMVIFIEQAISGLTIATDQYAPPNTTITVTLSVSTGSHMNLTVSFQGMSTDMSLVNPAIGNYSTSVAVVCPHIGSCNVTVYVSNNISSVSDVKTVTILERVRIIAINCEPKVEPTVEPTVEPKVESVNAIEYVYDLVVTWTYTGTSVVFNIMMDNSVVGSANQTAATVTVTSGLYLYPGIHVVTVTAQNALPFTDQMTKNISIDDRISNLSVSVSPAYIVVSGNVQVTFEVTTGTNLQVIMVLCTAEAVTSDYSNSDRGGYSQVVTLPGASITQPGVCSLVVNLTNSVSSAQRSVLVYVLSLPNMIYLSFNDMVGLHGFVFGLDLVVTFNATGTNLTFTVKLDGNVVGTVDHGAMTGTIDVNDYTIGHHLINVSAINDLNSPDYLTIDIYIDDLITGLACLADRAFIPVGDAVNVSCNVTTGTNIQMAYNFSISQQVVSDLNTVQGSRYEGSGTSAAYMIADYYTLHVCVKNNVSEQTASIDLGVEYPIQGLSFLVLSSCSSVIFEIQLAGGDPPTGAVMETDFGDGSPLVIEVFAVTPTQPVMSSHDCPVYGNYSGRVVVRNNLSETFDLNVTFKCSKLNF